MPEPGDYDYNDVVLRISQERTALHQITLNVTLAAVGSMKQVAAAICLPGIKYDDIALVKTTDGETFNDGFKWTSISYLTSKDLLSKGKKDVAVINLFEDAHWATGATNYTSEGYIPRYKYNVSKTTGDDYEMTSPRTVSYEITFKDSVMLDYLTLEQLDPFIIEEYNGALMEVHAAYRLRTSLVLHEYVQPTSAVILPWALIVPSGAFRYPLNGVHVGFYKNGALFGAYMTKDHAFGEWASNHEKALDWYNYPTSNMVY
jgi:LruC domain-containing protein